ncbi:low molecular weight protein-tyrosine-phosphatase [Oceanobacter sp. 3_MG-2023]|uniref:low molecular weight protein-tyrosine-phosphatase n=2 Tax=Gammaproteobacteria TaxID=1236 RepID=UPI002732A32E|nr:low molecular weight protein-tyrosine-phosphatase [Oceanobacter sp. 3_MG-2023]MDP2504253.1 low molecular weight protein-tyrosine-phosphatase [Oceanobacter sp. 3_MG-2023]
MTVTATPQLSVLFVCLGNICRSPTAHGVFQKMVDNAGLSDRVRIDSAGTAAWHIGKCPDSRAISAAAGRGYNLSVLKARQVIAEDLQVFDYVLAMDSANLVELQQLAREQQGLQTDGAAVTTPSRFLQFAHNTPLLDVPDPYYGGDDGFDQVLDMVEDGCRGLLAEIRRQTGLVS